jgi:hypothetical protein
MQPSVDSCPGPGIDGRAGGRRRPRTLFGVAAAVVAVVGLVVGLVVGAGGVPTAPPDPSAAAGSTLPASAAGQSRSAGITFSTVASTSGPAPLSARRIGIWYSPPSDQYTAASLWKFDPVSHSVPSGFRTDYVKIGSLPPYPKSFPFTYRASGNRVYTQSPTGYRGTITLDSYSSSRGILWVHWDGYARVWYSCASSAFPAIYRVYC